jgi:nucleotide-binding universal stress UspA family protein
MFKKILVAVDGSATSARGLQWAVKLAKDQKATLILLHVVDEKVATQSLVAGGYFIDGLIEGLVAGGKKILARAVKTATKQGVKVQAELAEDIAYPVADIIVAQAKKLRADLIVLGTHGRRGIGRMVMGSDAEGVVRMTAVPVFLVRAAVQARKSKKRARRK